MVQSELNNIGFDISFQFILRQSSSTRKYNFNSNSNTGSIYRRLVKNVRQIVLKLKKKNI